MGWRTAVLLLLIAWAVQECGSFSLARASAGPAAPCAPLPSRALSAGHALPARRQRLAAAPGGARQLRAAQLPELDEVGGVALTHHYVTVDEGVKLHVVEAGGVGADAPTVCLLHGFPDFWLSWRRQLPALVGAGFRVLCPDLRGYAKSSKPPGIHRYSEVCGCTGPAHARMHACTHTHTPAYLHTHTHTHIRTRMHARARARARTHFVPATREGSAVISSGVTGGCVCVCVCVCCVCMLVLMCIPAHAYKRAVQVEITSDIDALRKHFCGEDGQFELLVGHDWGRD